MMIHEITEKVGRHKRRKRIGRGPGSGTGKTAGRGHKGYGSRSGNSNPHEGGGTPLWKALPKRGFTNAMFKKHFAVVNLSAIDSRFENGAEINPEMLVKHGLIRDTKLKGKSPRPAEALPWHEMAPVDGLVTRQSDKLISI